MSEKIFSVRVKAEILIFPKLTDSFWEAITLSLWSWHQKLYLYI